MKLIFLKCVQSTKDYDRFFFWLLLILFFMYVHNSEKFDPSYIQWPSKGAHNFNERQIGLNH